MKLTDGIKAAKDYLARAEAELAAIPDELKAKTDEELIAILYHIINYFGGTIPPKPTDTPAAPVDPAAPTPPNLG